MSETLFLKKNLFSFFYNIKIDLIFLLSKNHLSYYHKIDLIFYKPKKKKKKKLVLKKTDMILFKSKDFILCNKHRSEFLSPKTTFFFILQNISGILTNQNQFFFYQPKQIWFFSKEETSFINKFVWSNFWFTCSTYHSWHA